jgi:hypothetical protein
MLSSVEFESIVIGHTNDECIGLEGKSVYKSNIHPLLVDVARSVYICQ